MFSLDGGLRYWLYSEPTDMRKSFHTLSGVVRNKIGGDPMNGDVYIFVNKRRNRIKLLHYETGGMAPVPMKRPANCYEAIAAPSRPTGTMPTTSLKAILISRSSTAGRTPGENGLTLWMKISIRQAKQWLTSIISII